MLLLGRYGLRTGWKHRRGCRRTIGLVQGQMPASDRQANLRYMHTHMHTSAAANPGTVRSGTLVLSFALLCYACPSPTEKPRGSPPGQCKTTAGAKTPPDGRRAKGAYSVYESRLVSSAALHLAWLAGSWSPRLRLRLPGVSPLTARARLPRDYCTTVGWLLAPKRKGQSTGLGWIDLCWRALPVVAGSLES